MPGKVAFPSTGFGGSPRCKIITTKIAQKITSSDPLINCTQVVLTIPAVVTMKITMPPTSVTPIAWFRSRPCQSHDFRLSSAFSNAPAPTICGMR